MARQLFDPAVMIPPAWQAQAQGKQVQIFNPAILCLAGQWVLAYRVEIRPTGHHIAICRLDDNLQIQPATIMPLSDELVSRDILPEDPRLLSYRGGLWLYYNHRRPNQPNQMALVSLDPATLRPTAAARPLLLSERRQWMEKNWLLFVYEDELYAVYRMVPHVILRLDLSAPDVVHCHPIYNVAWADGGYAQRYGELRGGTPPVQIGDYYYSFFHSWYSSSRVDRLVRPPALASYQWLTQLRSPMRAAFKHRLAATLPHTKAGGGRHSRLADKASFLPLPGRVQGEGKQAPLDPACDTIERPLTQQRTFLSRLLFHYRRRFEQRWYVAGFYAFAAQPPFAPVGFIPQPILTPHPSDHRLFTQLLNPYVNRVVFPTGAVLRADGQWVVSYGINDELAAVCTFDHQELLQAMSVKPACIAQDRHVIK